MPNGQVRPRLAKSAALTTGLTACKLTLSAVGEPGHRLGRSQVAIVAICLPERG